MMTRKVSISSVKVPLFKLRRLVLALVFLFAAQGVWGDAYTWKGLDTNPGNINNWKTETDDPATNYPGSSASDTVLIPSDLTNYPSVDPSLIDNIASVKIDGQLTITGDFTLAKIDAASEGTLIVTGTLTNSSNFEATNLSVVFNSYHSDSGWLKCKKITIDGPDPSNPSLITGKPKLISTAGTGGGININKAVVVTTTSSTEQCVLAGDVNASNNVTITVTGGMLNHVNEGSLSSWSDKITVDLKGSDYDCSLGMQEGKSYNIKVSANSGDVYFVGSGTIASLNDSGAGCDIHFGNNDNGPNAFTFGDDIEFKTSGDIIIDKSCSGLSGSKTLSGINNLRRIRGPSNDPPDNVSPQIATLGVNLELKAGAEITGYSMVFDAVTCKGDTTISGNHTFTNFTAGTNISDLGGKTLTINGAQTITGDVSLYGAGTGSDALTIAGSGSLALTNTLTAQYLNFAATAPSATAGKAYASNSTGTATGWVVVDGAQHVWNGSSEGDGQKWEEKTNWLPPDAPPGTDADVIINASSYNPIVSSNVTVNSITMNGDSELTVTGAFTVKTTSITLGTDASVVVNNEAARFEITADTDTTLNNQISGTGTLVLSGVKTYTIPTGKTFDINIENNGILNSSGDGAVIVSKSFNNTGEATFTNGIQLAGNFTDSGTSFSGNITLNGTGEQIFSNTGTTTSFAVAINKSNDKDVEFENAFTLTSLTANSEYTGAITFSASGNQTFTPQSAVYQNITVNKSAGSLIINGNLKVKTLTLTDGEVTFNGNLTLTDDAATPTYQDADFTGIQDTITFTGGTSVSPNVLTAASIQSSAKINADYLKLDGTTIQLTSTQNINHLTLKGSTSVSINGITAQSLSIDSSTPAINLSGTILLASTTDDFVIASSVTLTGDTTISVGKDVAFNETITSSNSLSITAANLTFGGNVSVKDLTINAVATTTKDITVSGNWTNNKAKDGDAFSFTATAGTVTLTGANPFDGQSSVILAGDNKFNSLVIQDSIQITGSNEIGTLTANTKADGSTGLGGKTITFGSGTTQNVTTSMTLKGTGTETGLLTLTSTGTWNINCPSNCADNLLYLSVKNSNSTNTLKVTNCTDATGNSYWIFVGQEYTWKGGSGSTEAEKKKWDRAANWEPASIPCLGSTVIIPEGKDYYPVLSAAVDIADPESDNGTITIQAASETTKQGCLDFNGQSLTAKSITNNGEIDFAGGSLNVTTITNNGTVHLLGTETITGTMKNGDDGKQGTVEYYGDAETFAFKWDVDGSSTKKYNNLIINQKNNSSDILEVAGNLEIDKAVTLTGVVSVAGTITIVAGTGNAVSLNNSSNSFNVIKLGDSTTNPTVNAGIVTLNAASAISFDDNAYANSITCNCASNIKNIEVTDSVTFEKPVTLLSATKITSAAGENIHFKDTVSGSFALETATGSVKFDGTISNLTSLTTDATATFNTNATVNVGILSTKTANINCASITTTSSDNANVSQIFDGPVTISSASGTTFTAPANKLINFKNTVTGSGSNTLTTVYGNSQFDGAISNLTTLTTAGTTTFNTNVTFNNIGTLSTQKAEINCTAITTTGNQTYNDIVTLSYNGNITLTAKNDSDEYQVVQFNGNIERPNTGTHNLIVDANTKINCADIKASSVDFKQSVTLLKGTKITTSSGNKIHFGGTLTGGGFALQTVTGSVTFDEAITNLTSLTTAATATFNENATVSNVGTLSIQIADIKCQSISTTGNQTYNRNVTLSYDGDINFTAKNASNVYQTVRFNGNIGKSNTGTHNLIVDANTSINCAEIKANSVDFKQPVTLYKGTSITTDSGEKIHFEGTLTGAFALATATGSVNFDGAITNLTSLTTDATATFNTNATVNVGVLSTKTVVIKSATITTTSSDTENNSQVFDGSVSVESANGTTFTAPEDKLIYFKNTVTGSGSNTLTTATGNSQFDDAISNLTTLTTDGTATFNTNVTFNNIGTLSTQKAEINCTAITTTGNQTYNDTVKLSYTENITLRAKNVQNALQTVTFKADVSCSDSQVRNLIVDANTQIDCSSISTTGTQEYKGTVILLKGSEITLRAKSGNTLQNLTFNDRISGTTAGTLLTMDANVIINTDRITTPGNQTYNGTVTLKKDGTITLTAKNTQNELQTVLFKNSVSCSDTNTRNLIVDAKTQIDCASITTTGTQEYKGTVTLLKGSEITLAAKSGNTLQNLTFNDRVSGTTAGTLLTVDANVIINTDEIKTPGNQTYNGTVTLKKDGTITLTAKNTQNELQTVTFNADVSCSDNQAKNLVIDAKTQIACASITTTGTQTYNGIVTLKKDGTITLTAKNAQNALQTILFKDNINCFDTTVRNLIVNANTHFDCASITTTGDQTYNGEIKLIKADEIKLTANNTSDGYKTVQFNGNITNADTATQNLVVDAKTNINCTEIQVNSVDFKQPVTLYKGTKITSDSGETIHFRQTLTGAFTLETVTGSVIFDGAITDLTSLKTAATATFNTNATVSVGKLSTKTAVIYSASITTTSDDTNSQTYDGPVTIGSTSGTIFEAPEGKRIYFKNTVTSNNSSTLTTVGGNSQFDGEITNLTSLTTDATVTFNTNATVNVGKLSTKTAKINSATITTTSSNDENVSQVFDGPVTISSASSTTFTAPADKLIYFKNTVTGNNANTLTTVSGNSQFDGAITKFAALTTAATATFNTNATVNVGKLSTETAVIKSSSITTTSSDAENVSQIFDGPVTISSASGTTFTAPANKLINFKNTVTGIGSNTLTTATGNSQFDGAVSNFASLTTAAKVTFNESATVNVGMLSTKEAVINSGSITTTSDEANSQTYDGPVTIGSAPGTTFTAPADKLIYFKNTVTGNNSNTLTTASGNSQFDGAITNLASLTTAATATFNTNATVNVGKLSTETAVIKSASITTTSSDEQNVSQVFDGLVTIGSASGTTFKAPADKLIYFKNNIAGSGSNTLTTVIGNSTFDGTITNLTSLKTDATATFNGDVTVTTIDAKTAIINCYKVTTTGSQSYSGPVVSKAQEITSDSTLKFKDELEIQEETQLTATNAIFEKAVTINGDTTITASAATSETIRFKDEITGDHSLETQTGSVRFEESISGLTALTTDATATFNGTVDVGALQTQTARFNANVTADSIETQAATIWCDTITTTGNQTYNGTVTIRNPAGLSSGNTISFNDLLTLSADTTLTAATQINYQKNITDGGSGTTNRKTLTIDSPVFNSTAAAGNSVTITLGELAFIQDETKLESTNNTTVNLNAESIDGVGNTVVIRNANFAMPHAPSSASIVVEPNIRTEAGSTFTAASGTTTFNGDVDFADGTLDANGGEIVLTAANKAGANPPVAVLNGNNTYKHLTFSGGVTMTGSNIINGALLLTGTTPVTIENNNTIATFTAGNGTTGLGGKTITFGAGTTQTVTGKLQLMGTANNEDNRLELCSSDEGTAWTINCTGANAHSIKYVDIQDSDNASAYNLFALDSNDSGNNINWNFPEMQYTWVSGATTNENDWNTKENWSPASVPNKGAVVTIPAEKISYPILTQSLDLNDVYDSKHYNGTITVAEGATFDLADENLTVGTITNNGLVRLNGTDSQRIEGTMINDGTDSTVEYYDDTGTATISNFVWDGDANQAGAQYEKLHINAQVNSDEKIIVHNVTTITAGTGNSVVLNNGGNEFYRNIMLGDSSASIPVNAGAVTLYSSGTITLDDNAYADSFICNCHVDLKNITTIGNQTYNGLVTLLDSATFETTGDSSLITLNASLQGKTATGKSLTVDSALKLDNNCSFIRDLDSATFEKSVEILGNTKITTAAGDTILFNDEITGSGSLETVTGSVEFEKTIIGLSSLKTAATATFNDDVDIAILNTQIAKINCGSITANSATFEDCVTLLHDTEITTDAADNTAKLNFKKQVAGGGNYSLKTIDGSVIFDGIINDVTYLITDATVTFNGNVTAGTLHAQTAKINCAEITTSGNQTYDGPVTLLKAGDIKLTAKNGNDYNTVQFNANINNSNAGNENLIVDAETNINCAAITVNSATFNQPVTLSHNTIITTDLAGEAKLIFKKQVSGGGNYSLETQTGSVRFEKSISGLTALTTAETATFNDDITAGTIETWRADINCSSITTNAATDANQTYKAAVQILKDTTLTIASGSSGTITFDAAVNGNNKLAFEAGTNNIIFNNKVGKTGAAGQADSPLRELQITTAANTTFNDVVCIGTFVDTASSGNITFKKSGKINTVNGQTFNTTGTVVFGEPNNDSAEMIIGSNLTHVAGTTKLYGKLTAPELDITLGNAELTGTITATNITLGQIENAVITGGPVTITNTGLFKTVDCSSLDFTTSFTQNGTGKSTIGGSFTGNGPATFATDVMIYGTGAADFGTSGQSIKVGAGTSGSSTANKNLIISRSAPATSPLTINAAAVMAKNIVLYNGAVVLNGDMTAYQDMIILGQDYSTTDSATGIADEYSYYCARPSTWSQPNYDDLPVEGQYNATLSVAADKTITVVKNFYANGTTLSTNSTGGQWILKLPDITNAANGFAEAYHSSISGCNVHCSNGSTDGTKARLVTLECTDAGTNTNVDFDDFEITAAYTERDNSIRVEFNRFVRYHSGTVEALKFLNTADSPELNFASDSTEFDLYSDPDCQHPIEYDTQLKYFYIKATPQNGSEYGAWNTDATGRSSGADDDQSTDRSGIHHETKPALDFPRALSGLPFIITDRWGKRLVNYSVRTPSVGATYGSSGDTDTNHQVQDKTGPVLYSVRTGQELHNDYDSSVGESSEHSYDSHNFIEFVYSEKVDFNGTNADDTLNAPLSSPENIQVTDSLGAIMGDITKSDNLRIAGLGTIEKGLIYTGSNGHTDKYVNALYRNGSNAEYSIKLSIAGYTNGTVTDTNGFIYKKWVGYIEQAEMPSGTVKHLVSNDKKNERVKDKAGNVQIKYENNSAGQPVYDTIPLVNSTESGLYGAWDISEPVFAIIRYDKSEDKWDSQQFDSNQKVRAEAIGNNSGVGSTLDRIEFHLYDNTPDVGSTEPEWFTEVGWCNPNSDGNKDSDLYKNYSYAADMFGGARPFDDESRRTSGGVRYSTIHSAVSAFKYGLKDSAPTNNFDTSKIASGGASSLIFTGVSSPRRSAGDLEGLYFSLPLENTTLDITNSFTIKYDETKGYVTDLAGNRLRSKTFTTIDRTPPSIDMTVCPVGGDELEIIFVKKISTNSENIKYYVLNENNEIEKVNIPEQFEYLITGCFDFITIDSSGMYQVVDDLSVDQTVPAQISISTNKNNSSFTSIRLKLSRTVTLDDIKNLYVRVKSHPNYKEESIDLFTGHTGSRVTFIQDNDRNNIQMYTAHALSDFAVGVINPLYAYDSSMTEDDGSIVTDSLLQRNLTDDVDVYGWAVHDWNRDQQNYGTLPAKRPVAIVADTSDGTLENENAPDSFRLYLTNNPDALSVSTQYNNDLEPATEWRIWLPDATEDVFTALSEKNNTKYSKVDGTLLSDDKSDRMIFDIDETITNKWTAQNQISFLFGLTNSDGSPVTIMHSPELDINNDMQYLPSSVKMPLFALRQTDPDDLMSLDLWSFRLKSNISQRGGVTILNNVIDSAAGEKAVVKVDVPEDGNLTVLVMTLDGNIVDYLHRGSAKAGEHFYTWDGSNRKGNPVARGMYFIRVTGPGLDETRKVLVVKE